MTLTAPQVAFRDSEHSVALLQRRDLRGALDLDSNARSKKFWSNIRALSS
jgi:hypothetical protein